MATAATIKKNIAKLEAALKSKATPKSLKSKLEAQLVKSKAELSGINKGNKPKTSSTKSTQTALQKLKEMVNKNKKLKTYKKSGVDLEKDADRPAKPIGKRTAKSGNTYYEYRANRIDVKQPPKRYPKLEKGGYMAKGGEVGGRGWSNYEKGDRITNISELKVGQSYLEYDKQFNSKNIIRITSSDKTPLNRDIVYAGFVRDKNDKRIEGDFAIWGSTLDENEIYEIKEPKKKGGYMADGGELKNLIGKEYRPFTATSSNEHNVQIVDIDFDNVTYKYKDGEVKKAKTSDFLDSYIQVKEKGGYMADGGELKVREDFKYQNTAKRWLEDHDGKSLAYKVAVLLLKGDNNPDETLNIDYERYTRVLRSLDSISESKHEMAWRTENYSQAEAQNWAKETVSNIFELNDTDKMAKGGKIKNQYEGKTAEKVWEQWTEEQRSHFLLDHSELLDKDRLENNLGYSRTIQKDKKYEDLTPHTKRVLESHVGSGQYAKGGYFAKGGLTEHGLKVGDTIVDDMFWDKSVKVLNNKTGYAVVKIETGERKEMKAMGGEMHRTQE